MTDYTLTPSERAAVDEILVPMNNQLQGALRMLCKIRELDGNWQYDAATGTLRKQE